MHFFKIIYAWSLFIQMELRSTHEIYLLRKLRLVPLLARRCSFHQSCKIGLLLIWWQAPYAPYEKGVNKMHVGNIKQGQGRQFGWRPFFKCGKQKNKIVLAVAAVGRAAWVGEWQPKSLLPVSCVHQDHCSLPNAKTLHNRRPSFGKSQQEQRSKKSPFCSQRELWGVKGCSGGRYGVRLRVGSLRVTPDSKTPMALCPSRASRDEWCYCVHCKSHPDWMQVSGGFLKISA